MASEITAKPATAGAVNRLQDDRLGSAINSQIKAGQTKNQPQRGWRDRLRVHPAADLLPLMSKDQARQLAEDIEKHGLREKPAVWLDRDTKTYVLLDGRHRLDALELKGDELNHAFADAKPKRDKPSWYTFGNNCWGSVEYFQAVDDDPYEYAASRNIHRRHLTSDQTRDVIAKLLKHNPEKSDRGIAKLAGADHKTVAKERRRQEDVGTIPHVARRTDAKGRKQPAIRKAAPKPVAKQSLLGTGEVMVTEVAVTKAGEKAAKQSARNLAEFTVACRCWLPGITEESDRQKARALVSKYMDGKPEAEAAS
jgi:ParB-like chromosome segregation protein Spo0J